MQLFKAVLLPLAVHVAGMRSNTGAHLAARTGDRTITQVVKLLQDMLDKSKADGENERELYAKYKCYCDTNEASKKAEIETLTEEIAVLESGIEELMSSSAVLSKEVAKLKKDMEENVQARDDAEAARDKEKKAYDDLEADLSDAIAKMKEAIEVLSEVGADQTMASGADHAQYMAGKDSLVKLRSTVKQALLAASSSIKPKQNKVVQAFLQAPFTGTYTAQSGEVVGILKDMRDTFENNLDAATKAEEAAVEAHDKYMETMTKAHEEMEESYEAKQGTLSTNDSDLATKRTQLDDAAKQKEDAQAFLEQLLEQCSEKAKQYEERVGLRTKEETAIAQAIAILNSDAAFESFGKVEATKSGGTGAFFQTIQRHKVATIKEQKRTYVQGVLRKAAAKAKSTRLGKVVSLLNAGNPFKTVLAEIDKLIALIAEEEEADDKQLKFCEDERKENNDNLDDKNKQVDTLETSINDLKDVIEAPTTGLRDQITADEESLQTNSESQKTETEDRIKDNLLYQKNIENLVEAGALLKKAITVLKAYYNKILGEGGEPEPSLVQTAEPEEPAPPDTWEGDYKGQKEDGGNDAVSMLEFILENTKAEEEAAHDEEKTAQHSYEDSMTSLKEEEKMLQDNLSSLRKSLAEKEEELLVKKQDLKTTKAEVKAIEAYLEEIKPGCDFITDNIEARKANRVTEEGALTAAKDALEDSPAYKTAMAEAHNESLGKCLDICAGREDHAECKACLADTSVPGYCAGHPDTEGC